MASTTVAWSEALKSQELQIYTPYKVIKDELKRRQKDTHLLSEVRKFFNSDYPDFLPYHDSQYAFLSRCIITPNMEARFFLDMIEAFNLNPLFLEYPGKFVSRNIEKYYLSKLRFFEKTKKGKTSITVRTITDFNFWEGRDLATVETYWGQNIISFHRELFLKKFPKLDKNICDITNWFNTVRSKHEHYYSGFYALAVCNGVIFENYLLEQNDEREFFFSKALPSFEAVKKRFGVVPLIHPVVPTSSAHEPNWLYYPIEELKHIRV